MEAAFDQLAEAIYKAPFALLAHNSFEEGVTDPKFTYANKAALELFEGTWNEIVGLPSRLSAEENDSIQAVRVHLSAVMVLVLYQVQNAVVILLVACCMWRCRSHSGEKSADATVVASLTQQ